MTDTSKAPERVWIDPADNTSRHARFDARQEPREGWTEYVRADLYAALLARVEAAEKLAEAVRVSLAAETMYESYDADKGLKDALAAWDALPR